MAAQTGYIYIEEGADEDVKILPPEGGGSGQKTASTIGSALGGVAGSVVPGAGTGVGAGIGGTFGGFASGLFEDRVGLAGLVEEKMAEHVPFMRVEGPRVVSDRPITKEQARKVVKKTAETLGSREPGKVGDWASSAVFSNRSHGNRDVLRFPIKPAPQPTRSGRGGGRNYSYLPEYLRDNGVQTTTDTSDDGGGSTGARTPEGTRSDGGILPSSTTGKIAVFGIAALLLGRRG
jgi:hypothetical protein